ncbi:Ribosomal-protein-alanine acetyltransferase [Pyrenophora teres f. maculata]|nr:Ribosomal-protein-alanine acetyltransferase [Pyrenophora teres f. maculata]
MSRFDFHITTPRLYLSYCNSTLDSHCDFFLELLHGAPSRKWHPNILETMPDHEAARKLLEAGDERLIRTGYGRYLISLKPEKEDEPEKLFSERELEHIGVVSMQLARVDGMPGPTIPDVGFNMMEKYHGKGYATEAVQGLVKYYNETKGIKEFAGLTHVTNEPSMKLFRRAGFKSWGTRIVKGIMWTGEAIEVNVWTWGIAEGRKLEEFGM